MDIKKLKRLLQKEEGPKLDFKECIHLENDSQKKEFAKDVSAMANSKGGRGYIIFGVRDKTKEIVGIDPNLFQEERLQQIVYHRIDPPVPIKIEVLSIKNKNVVVLTVYANSNKPHMIIQSGNYFIRRGSTTDYARRSELASLFQEHGLLTFETVVLKNALIDSLDKDMLKKYFKNMGVNVENISEVLLESTGIIGRDSCSDKYFVTIGGMLLFGDRPSLFIPNANITVLYKDECKIFNGNILTLLNEVSLYINQIINKKGYPINALEDAIANALVHRDYLDMSRGIQIIIEKDKIEISNPGAMLAGTTVYKYIRENHPERRNPWLYQRLLVLDEKKRFMQTGIGLKRIRKEFKDIGKVKFINIGRENLFKVILPIKDM